MLNVEAVERRFLAERSRMTTQEFVCPELRLAMCHAIPPGLHWPSSHQQQGRETLVEGGGAVLPWTGGHLQYVPGERGHPNHHVSALSFRYVQFQWCSCKTLSHSACPAKALSCCMPKSWWHPAHRVGHSPEQSLALRVL